MTLLDILPSLRTAVRPRLDPTLWPHTTHADEAGRLTVGGLALADIADEVGTPAYVIDEADFRYRARRYRKELPGTKVVYAGKALLTTAVARWAADEHLGVDVCSAGELATALAGGVAPARIVCRGRTHDELAAAVAARVGRIVVDSTIQITYLAGLARHPQNVLVHDARLAAAVVREPMLRLTGLHCQVTGAEQHGDVVRQTICTLADVRRAHGVVLGEMNIGGDTELDLRALSLSLEDALDACCAAERFPRPTIVVEPGRGLAARAGVTLYRVLSVSAGQVTVDGGPGDCPGCDGHTATLVNRHPLVPSQPRTIVGGGCELVRDADLPRDVHAGDLIAMAGTGAYHHSVASSCHMVGRPPVVAVCDSRLRTLVRRETVADVLARDRG
jgi:diaminopimelate decarboxylase